MANSFVRTKLADAMAHDFQRDLESDGIPLEKIQAQVKRSKDRIISAPVAILLCLDMSEMDRYPDKRRTKAEFRMTVQSVAAAGMQLLLAAHAEGLGAVWACWVLFAVETIQEVLELPKTWEPQALYFLGYPDGNPKEKILKVMKSVVRTI